MLFWHHLTRRMGESAVKPCGDLKAMQIFASNMLVAHTRRQDIYDFGEIDKAKEKRLWTGIKVNVRVLCECSDKALRYLKQHMKCFLVYWR